MNQRLAPETTRAGRRVHPFLWDFGLTSMAQILVLASGVLIVSFFGRLLGAVALRQHLLLRRVVA